MRLIQAPGITIELMEGFYPFISVRVGNDRFPTD